MDDEQLSEQRKLIFGMLFSLRELCSSLSPVEGPGDLHLIKTGASTLYNFETVSGLKFALYTTPETSIVSATSGSSTTMTTTSATMGGPSSSTGPLPPPSSLGNSTTTTMTGSGLGVGGTGVGVGTAPSSGPSGYSFGITASAASSAMTAMANPIMTETIRAALQHIYEHIWVTFVVRSPMYQASDPDIASTNFEASLDNYLRGMPWFK